MSDRGWFAALAESVPHIVWSADGKGTHDYSNRQWTDYTGVAPAGTTDDAWMELVHPDDRAAFREQWNRAMATGDAFEAEYRLRRHDGAHRWHVSRGRAQRGEDGRVIRWFGTTTDIDDSRRAHDALRDSERRFRDMAENIREVFWLIDDRDTIMYVSPAYEDVWGRSRAALYANNGEFLDGIHEHDREAVRYSLAQRREPQVLVYRVVRPDGTVRWVQDRAFPIRDSTGTVTRIAGFAEDITERREMEAGLRFQAQLLASVQQAIVSANVAGVITSWNAHAHVIYGWTAAEAIGRPLAELMCAHDDHADADVTLAVLRNGGSVTHERRARRKDGSAVWVSIAGVPLFDADGRVAQILCTSTDITERRALEDQFRQAQKLEAVGRLAGGVAHDFNNLLTVINASTEFLSRALPTEGPMRDDLNEIAKSAQRATGLTRQLLAFSRQQILERRVIDPNATLAQLERMLGRLIGEDITLLVTPNTDTPQVFADEGQLEQVIANLVVNARDAMPRGGLLTLGTRRAVVGRGTTRHGSQVEPGEYAAITVTDNGIGMPPDVQTRIFEPFFTTKDAGRGTGLGLSTVYGIVRQSGGFVEVQSTMAKGSTFTVYLPASTQRGERSVAASATPSASAPVCAGRVLIVEDQPEVRAIAHRILAEHGYDVIVADDSAHALRWLRDPTNSLDVLVTDAVMPEVGGAELIRALRRARPSTPALVVSGYTDRTWERESTPDPLTSFLQKPFRTDELLRAVRVALGAGCRTGQPRAGFSAHACDVQS